MGWRAIAAFLYETEVGPVIGFYCYPLPFEADSLKKANKIAFELLEEKIEMESKREDFITYNWYVVPLK